MRRPAAAALVLAAIVVGGLAVWIARSGDTPSGGAAAPEAAPATRSEEAHPSPSTPARELVADERPAAPPADPAYVGVVLAPAKTPVEGAVVTAYTVARDWRDAETLGEARTGEDGRFRIPAAAPGARAVLRATAPGFAERAVRPVVPDEEALIVLFLAAEVFGRVTESGTGAPIPGASLTIHGQATESDAGGSYRFTAVPVGIPLYLEASKEGFLPVMRRTQLERREAAELDVELDRGVEVTVTVVDRDVETPVEGAEVRLTRRSDPFAVTGPDGTFPLRVADGSRFGILVRAEGYAPFDWSWEVQDVRRLAAPRIPLRRVGWIDGVVVDESGKSMSGLSVDVECEEHPFLRFRPTAEEKARFGLPGNSWSTLGWMDLFDESSDETDEAGRFSLPVVPDESPYFVSAHAGESGAGRSEAVVVAASGDRREVRIVLTEGATVRGHLRCNGEPWSEGYVFWKSGDGERGMADPEDDGSYVLKRLPTGVVTVRVLAEFGAPVVEPFDLSLESGREYEHDVEWTQELAVLAGRVTDTRGDPLGDVQVNASRDDGDDGLHHYDVRTSEDGTFSIDVVKGAPYDVRAYRKPQWQKRLGVQPGTTGLEFVFGDVGRLALRFVDASTGAAVSLEESGSRALAWRVGGDAEFQTIREDLDHRGRVELGLPIGRVDLALHPQEDGYAPRRVLGVRVAAEVNDPPLTVELTRGAEVRIELSGDGPLDRERLAGHLFFLLERNQLDRIRGPFERQGGESNIRINGVCMWLAEHGLTQQMLPLDETGLALATGLAPGTYTLRAYPDDFAFEPATFEVVAPRTEVEVRWAGR